MHQLKFLIISHELNPGEQFGSLSVTFPIYVIIINVCVSTYISSGVKPWQHWMLSIAKNDSDFKLL
jgi:hypothetical protein